jgi:hypothetical protein
MTFVVCDCKFLITDKRTATHSGVGGHNNGKVPGLSNKTSFRDDGVKIIVPDKKIYTSRQSSKNFDPQEYVVAVAMTGTYLSKVNHPISILMELESMQSYCAMLNNSVFKNFDFCMTALLANGQMAHLRKDPKSEDNDWHLTAYKPDGSGKPTLIQSGSGMVDVYIKELYMAKEITLLELFLYGAHMNDHCSTDYSVYSLEHNHLYGSIRPSEEEVKAAVDKIHKLLEFKGLKKHYR